MFRTTQLAAMVAAALAAWFVLAQLELHSPHYEKLTSGVMRPSATPQPQDAEALLEQLSQATDGVVLRFDPATHILVIEPDIVETGVPNPWLSTTIHLAEADPYIFAQRRRYPKYQLVLFCVHQQRCITVSHANSGQKNRNFDWILGDDSRTAARSQLDILRALITTSGGVSTLDSTQTLNQLIWAAETVEH